ncbi:MAG: hypothetical protein GYB66_07315, partial [Chloroflexi bacterium]|nr:hypothetical protein [Chloroflexota bacterium]
DVYKRQPQGLFTVTPDSAPQRTLAPGERLPTFTFPPFTNTPIPIAELQAPPSDSSSQDSALAPAIPVLGLFALGMLGLLISVFRRL